MREGMWLLVAAVVLAAAGCTVFIPKETLYLESAQGRDDQEKVRAQLGTPQYTATALSGNPIWVYQVYWQDTTAQNSWGTPGTWCDEYVLTFDRQGILRNWTHKSEGHGGELSPTYCVKDGFQPAS